MWFNIFFNKIMDSQNNIRPLSSSRRWSHPELNNNTSTYYEEIHRDAQIRKILTQKQRNSDHSQNSFRMNEAITYTANKISKYTNFPECQELLNTITFYINPNHSPEVYFDYINDAIDRCLLVSADVSRSKTTYHDICNLLSVMGRSILFLGLPRRTPLPYKSYQSNLERSIWWINWTMETK